MRYITRTFVRGLRTLCIILSSNSINLFKRYVPPVLIHITGILCIILSSDSIDSFKIYVPPVLIHPAPTALLRWLGKV
jgi:hypothetical protein